MTRTTTYTFGTERYSSSETRHKLWLQALNLTKYKYKTLPPSLMPMKSPLVEDPVKPSGAISQVRIYYLRIWTDCLIIAARCHRLSAGFISSITNRSNLITHHKFSHCCSVLITFTRPLACEANLPKGFEVQK